MRSGTSISAALFVTATALAILSVPAQGAGPDFVVIVHPANPVNTLTRSRLERIYRRSARFWDDRVRVVPINTSFGNSLRDSFSREILRSSPDELVSFWNRQYFQGVMPPPVLKSPAAVRAYVATTRGAVGYIPADLLDDTVKVVDILGE
ncbi:MAG: hypothetical protein ACE5E4_07185 [Candidatus Binatia bacterium]